MELLATLVLRFNAMRVPLKNAIYYYEYYNSIQ